MCNTSVRETNAVTWCTATTAAHSGSVNFQQEARRCTPPAGHQLLFQEVIVIPVPAPNKKAAGATAASCALTSAITDNFIVPPLRRSAMGLRPFFVKLARIHPISTYKTASRQPHTH